MLSSKKRTIIIILLVLVVLVALVFFLTAKKGYTGYVYGWVMERSHNTIVIRSYDRSGDTQPFWVFTADETTTLQDEDGNTIRMEDIEPGMRICVGVPHSVSRFFPDDSWLPRSDVVPSSMQLIEYP